MRIVLQRVQSAWVDIEGAATAAIGTGLLALVGFRSGDTARLLRPMAEKMTNLRLFADSSGKLNLSMLDIGGGFVLVPQFTLYANCRKGRRPGFSDALEPVAAASLYDEFEGICRGMVPDMVGGRFGADMKVHMVNDGPLTILLDSFDLGMESPRSV